jgi:hypothetical protein
MEIRFSDDGAIIYVEYEEAPTLEKWISAVSSLKEDPRRQDAVAIIADRTRAGPPTPEFVQGAVPYLISNIEELSRYRLALVVPDAASFGMGRMVQMMLDEHGLSFDIFDDVERAEAWAREDTGEGESDDED